MIKQYNFTYCPMKINWTEELVKNILREVLELDDSYWHFNEFRNCKMLSVFNPGGRQGKVNLNIKDDFKFTEAANLCPSMVKFLREEVLWWMEPVGRVTILRTPPGVYMPLHLDCSLTESGTMQHKWRFVLKGDIEKLYFLDQDQTKIHVPVNNRCYSMDGGHPHSIDVSNTEKITICIGSPWRGDTLNLEYVSRLDLKNALYVPKPQLKKEWIDPILLK